LINNHAAFSIVATRFAQHGFKTSTYLCSGRLGSP
jgi:hypothetical protein